MISGQRDVEDDRARPDEGSRAREHTLFGTGGDGALSKDRGPSNGIMNIIAISGVFLYINAHKATVSHVWRRIHVAQLSSMQSCCCCCLSGRSTRTRGIHGRRWRRVM